MYKCFLKFISINKIQYKLFLEDCMLSYGYRSEKSCYTSRCFVVDLNPPFTLSLGYHFGSKRMS